MNSIETEIRQAIDTFDIDQARQLLRTALKNPTGELYYLAALVAVDEEQEHEFVEKAIELDPFHAEAHKLLAEIEPNQRQKEPHLSAETKTILQVIFSPLYDYKDAAYKVFNFQKLDSQVFKRLTTAEVISAVLGSAVVVFILGTLLKNTLNLEDGDFFNISNTIFVNELVYVIVFLFWSWINAVFLHFPMKWVGGKSNFRQLYRGNTLVMAALLPIILPFAWILSKYLDPTTVSQGILGATAMYYYGVAGKIHDMQKLPKWRRLAYVAVYFLLAIVLVGFIILLFIFGESIR